jgi:hypothetical protein
MRLVDGCSVVAAVAVLHADSSTVYVPLLLICLQDDHSNLTPHNFQAAAEFRPMIDQLYHDLCKR